MSLSIDVFQGDLLYLDTMVFHLLLRSRQEGVSELFRRLHAGEFQGYTSVLTLDELLYRLLLGAIRDEYGSSPLDRLRQDQSGMIRQFYPLFASQLADIQSYPNLTLVEVSSADLAAMHRNVRRHNLLPRDALHLAAMQKVACFSLVSQDADFDNIPGVQRYVLG